MGQTPQRWVGHSRLVLAVLCMTILLDALDLSITQVALPSVGADMRMPLTLLPWVANAYVLTYGGLLLLGGRLCDLCGRRRVFLAGLGLFGGMSLLAGLINQPVFLIGCRALQGVGAALTVPAAVAILAATFPQGEQRNRALGVFAAFAGTGFSVGLVAGGALTATLGWPWIFLIKVPVVVAVMVAGLAVVPSDSAPDSRRPLDLPGAATSTAGLLLLALTVTLVASPDPRWPVVIAAGVLAAALLIGFSVQERRARDPLLPARLLTNRSHVIADLGSLTVLAAPFGFAYLVSSYLQGVAGYGPMRTGLAVLPGAVLSAVVSRVVAPRLVAVVGVRLCAAASLVVVAAGLALLALVDEGPSYLTAVLPSCLVCLGLGMGVAYPVFSIAALTDVAEPEQGLAAGIQNAALQIGGGLGLAVISAAVDLLSPGATGPQALVPAVSGGALVGAALPLFGAAFALFFPRPPAAGTGDSPDHLSQRSRP